jgi:hypothetical protein
VKQQNLIIATFWAFVAVSAVPALAQRCVRVDTDPESATVTIENGSVVSQSTPANFCDLQPGQSYKATVFRSGFETRTLKFSFSGYGQPVSFSGIWPGVLARSVVLPGWGQKHMGQGFGTWVTWTLLIADGFKAWQAYDDYSHAKTRYDNMSVLAQISQTQEQIDERTRQANKLSDDANAYRESLILTASIGGWVYLHNLVETYLLAAPPKATRLEASDFRLKTPRKSAKRAVLRSFFFPGLGQQYAGHGGRAFLFRSGVFVLALFTVDAKLRYDLALSDRNAAVERYNSAPSVPEREALLPEVLIQEKSVEDRKDTLLAFAIATGSLWLANVFEAWGSGGGGREHSDRFEMSTTYRNATVYQEVRLRF